MKRTVIITAVIIMFGLAGAVNAAELLDFNFRWLQLRDYKVVDASGGTMIRTLIAWEWCGLVYSDLGEQGSMIVNLLHNTGTGSVTINSSSIVGSPGIEGEKWYCSQGSKIYPPSYIEDEMYLFITGSIFDVIYTHPDDQIHQGYPKVNLCEIGQCVTSDKKFKIE